MIRRISSSLSGFKTVELEQGFNLILAERTEESTKRDTRNGLGKSTLIEIIHFCLGAEIRKDSPLVRAGNLVGDYALVLDLVLQGHEIRVERNPLSPSRVRISGDTKPFFETTEQGTLTGDFEIAARDEWPTLLGKLWFGLPQDDRRFKPTFRSLISYSMRRGAGAYLDPFKSFSQQPSWQSQVCVAFLLGLDWKVVGDWQALRERKEALQHLQEAAKSEQFAFISGDIGELEAQEIIVRNQAAKLRGELAEFRVLPEYSTVQAEADQVTAVIASLSNSANSDARLLDSYALSLDQERGPTVETVADLYEEAGVHLGNAVRRTLQEVQAFHDQLVVNRRRFLEAEIERLRRRLNETGLQIDALEEQRSRLLTVLHSHGALETYTYLSERFQGLVAIEKGLAAQIDTLKDVRRATSQLAVEQQLVFQQALSDFDDRRLSRERAVTAFESIVESLYNAPGTLVLEVTQNGYRFGTKIERPESQGVGRMMIFAFDVTAASLLSPPLAKVLVHDSTLFDGVDERQRALALQSVKHASSTENFQYLVLMNSDEMPYSELGPDFNAAAYVRLVLTDAAPEGSLMGFRF